LTLSIPFASNYGYLVVALIRFLAGAFQGPIWPSFSGFWARWSPPNERSRLIAISNSGCQIGTVSYIHIDIRFLFYMLFSYCYLKIITLPLTAYLCEHGFAGGWPSIFYILGTVGVIWTILWIIFASDSPETNRFISNKEKVYISRSTQIDSNNSNKVTLSFKMFKKMFLLLNLFILENSMVKDIQITNMYSFIYRTYVFGLGSIFVLDFVTNLYEGSAKV
jgi:ACS family sodium-dependent inorganic phosphate cotransporter-like MFS transporter 5